MSCLGTPEKTNFDTILQNISPCLLESTGIKEKSDVKLILVPLQVIQFFSLEKFKIFFPFPLKNVFRSGICFSSPGWHSQVCSLRRLESFPNSEKVFYYVISLPLSPFFWSGICLMLQELLTLSSMSLNLSFIGYCFFCFHFCFSPLPLNLRDQD